MTALQVVLGWKKRFRCQHNAMHCGMLSCAVLCVQVRLVLEYCDKGCLRAALDDGVFVLGEWAVRQDTPHQDAYCEPLTVISMQACMRDRCLQLSWRRCNVIIHGLSTVALQQQLGLRNSSATVLQGRVRLAQYFCCCCCLCCCRKWWHQLLGHPGHCC